MFAISALQVVIVLTLLEGCIAWKPMHRVSSYFHNQMRPFFADGAASDFQVSNSPAKALAKFCSLALLTTSLTGTVIPQNVYADARLNAPTAAGTRVNSDAESLLRYGLPIDNKDIRAVQEAVDSMKMDLKTRLIDFAKQDVLKAQNILNKNSDSLLRALPASHKVQGTESLKRMKEAIPPLLQALRDEQDAGPGSLQERKGLDDAFTAQDVLAKEVGVFEELLIPDNFARKINDEYKSLPQLMRRATVEFVIKRPDGSQYDVDGKLYDRVRLKMIIDGFNAPITGGNFVDLVDKGFYKGLAITRSDGFVVQTGDADPNGKVHGYVPPGATEERKIPLELSLKGDKNLLYESTTDEDGRGYAASVLPFQAYGAMGMAREEFDVNSASTQFFWLLFESDLTPAGKNMLDGRYTEFGYVVDGADLLKDVKEGDIIESTKVVSGLEFLKRP